MSDKPITLEFLSRQQTQILNEMASFREDMGALRARLEALVDAFSKIERDLSESHKGFHDE